jgi:hypothetical protein
VIIEFTQRSSRVLPAGEESGTRQAGHALTTRLFFHGGYNETRSSALIIIVIRVIVIVIVIVSVIRVIITVIGVIVMVIGVIIVRIAIIIPATIISIIIIITRVAAILKLDLKSQERSIRLRYRVHFNIITD